MIGIHKWIAHAQRDGKESSQTEQASRRSSSARSLLSGLGGTDQPECPFVLVPRSGVHELRAVQPSMAKGDTLPTLRGLPTLEQALPEALAGLKYHTKLAGLLLEKLELPLPLFQEMCLSEKRARSFPPQAARGGNNEHRGPWLQAPWGALYLAASPNFPPWTHMNGVPSSGESAQGTHASVAEGRLVTGDPLSEGDFRVERDERMAFGCLSSEELSITEEIELQVYGALCHMTHMSALFREAQLQRQRASQRAVSSRARSAPSRGKLSQAASRYLSSREGDSRISSDRYLFGAGLSSEASESKSSELREDLLRLSKLPDPGSLEKPMQVKAAFDISPDGLITARARSG